MSSIIKQIKRNYRWWQLIHNADDVMLYYPEVKPKDNQVNIHIHDVIKTGYDYYNNGEYPYNLGDVLAMPIINFMLDKKGIKADKVVKGRKHLFTVGSGGLRSFQNTTIWGTGIMYDGLKGYWFEKYWYANHRHLDIRAVRGPLTREVFLRLGHQCPEVYGDPGILMPLIYQPDYSAVKRGGRDYAIIPQYTTENEVRKYFTDDMIISMNTNDYKSVIDKIVSCKKVYSSSLHGIILAEAYGVPAVFFRGISAVVDFKYKDYYASTGRYDIPMANNLAEAFSFESPEIPNLSGLQKGLMEVFPYDLWEV